MIIRHLYNLLFLMAATLLLSSCSLTRHRFKEYNPVTYVIPDVREYYSHALEHFKPDSIEVTKSGMPTCILEVGRTRITAIKTDTAFVVSIKIPKERLKSQTTTDSTLTCVYELTNDTYMYYFPLDIKDLCELFKFVDEPPFFYNIATSEYSPFYERFVLFDSFGEVRLMADRRTMRPTEEYFKKNYGKQLPLTEGSGGLLYGKWVAALMRSTDIRYHY